MKRIRMRTVALAVATALAAGCASTNVNRANDLSKAGVAYAKATSAVVDLAINASIDADSEAKIQATRPSALEPIDVRKKMLEETDQQLIVGVVRYTELRSAIGTLEAYFLALQELADGSQAEATGTAVKSLANRINKLNEALEKKVVFNEAQVTALEGLSKLVATQVHGAVVGGALKRDAEVIGKSIVLQQLVLKTAERDISTALSQENNRFWVNKVLAPYQEGTIDADWVENRRNFIKVKALGKSLETITTAQDAAAKMDVIWRKILSGEFSAAELAASLKETEELLTAVAVLKDAGKPKPKPTE
jgi:hypothetical protein